MVDEPYHLVSVGGLVADIRQPHLAADCFVSIIGIPLWHSGLQASQDCLGADRHENCAGAEMTYESF